MTRPDAAKCQTLLSEALALARRRAKAKPQPVRDILATGAVEDPQDGDEHAVVKYRAETYKRTWLTLIKWEYFEHFDLEACADSMIETVEANLRMTGTNSWPK